MKLFWIINLPLNRRVQASYATNLGGSGKLYLNIRNDPDNPIEFCMAIA